MLEGFFYLYKASILSHSSSLSPTAVTVTDGRNRSNMRNALAVPVPAVSVDASLATVFAARFAGKLSFFIKYLGVAAASENTGLKSAFDAFMTDAI